MTPGAGKRPAQAVGEAQFCTDIFNYYAGNGPGLIGVYKVSTDDEAVQLANMVDFGLGGAVWSTDEERAIKVAEQLEVGMANVNTPAGEGADLPFGGTKRSGFGRELGPSASTNSSTSASFTSRSSA